MELIALAVLGLGTLGFLMMGDDEPESTQDNPAPEPTAGNDYIDLDALAAGAQPQGGLGNDTIVADLGAPDLGPIDGGDGDDVIVERRGAGQIYGGDGNDHLTIDGLSTDALIDGGAGNDTITGTSLYDGDSTISGGAGDDMIELAYNYGPGQVLNIDGGDGDDTIRFQHAPSNGNSDGTMQYVSGGDGADRIEVELREGFIDLDRQSLHDTAFDLTEDGAIETIPSLFIDDFQPGIDKLVFEAEPDEDAVYPLALESYEIDVSEDGQDTHVVYRIISEANERPVQGTVVLRGVTGLSESDIEFEPADPSLAG